MAPTMLFLFCLCNLAMCEKPHGACSNSWNLSIHLKRCFQFNQIEQILSYSECTPGIYKIGELCLTSPADHASVSQKHKQMSKYSSYNCSLTWQFSFLCCWGVSVCVCLHTQILNKPPDHTPLYSLITEIPKVGDILHH